MVRVPIHNPPKFQAAQEKKAAKRQNLVDAAFWNIITIIDENHAGALHARNEVEVLDILIRFGVFGASSKFPLRVSRHRKDEHHWNLDEAAPTEIPEEFKWWYKLVIEALRLSESAGNIVIKHVDGGLTISTNNPPKPSPLLEELERQYGAIGVDHDEIYHPFARLDARLLASLGKEEAKAYK